MEDQATHITIDSDVETRKGVHANVVQASTRGGLTRLDFLSADLIGEDNEGRAVLSARVYLDNFDLLALRDMLNAHTAGWKVEHDGGEA